VLLIGSNLQKEQPLAALRVRQAGLKGAAILAVNPVDYAFNFKVTAKNIIAPHLMADALQEIVQALESGDTQNFVAQQLKDKKKIHILLGALALHHPQASLIRSLAHKLAKLCGATMGDMTSGGNAAGGWVAGAMPRNGGLNAYEMLHKPRAGYLLLNVEPEMDCANAHHAQAALKQAKCVVALSMYRKPVLLEHAQVILPIAAFTETSGTFINAFGDWQSFTGVANAFGQSRPAWKVLRVLGNFLELNGFDYESSEEIKNELKVQVEKTRAHSSEDASVNAHPISKDKLSRIGEVPLYATDSIVRRSQPLQDAQAVMEGELACVRLHPETARQLKVQEGDSVRVKQGSASAELVVKMDERIAKQAAWIAGGITATSSLGDLFGEIEIDSLR
jgi:NADH-quinone oxidoreductase subunit G